MGDYEIDLLSWNFTEMKGIYNQPARVHALGIM